jgi:hypothetical protein
MKRTGTLGIALLVLATAACTSNPQRASKGSSMDDTGGTGGTSSGGGGSGGSPTTGGAGRTGTAGTTGGGGGSTGSAGTTGGGGSGMQPTDAAMGGGTDAARDLRATADVILPDATTVGDAGAFGGGASRCAAGNFLLCEDFENGIDATKWGVSRPGGSTLMVDTVRPARGGRSLHLKHTGLGGPNIIQRKIFPIAGNSFYMRMFVWFVNPVMGGHFSLAQGQGSGSSDVARFGGISQRLGVGSDGGPSGDWTDTDNVVLPSGKWLCLEWRYDGPQNMFQGWWDDVERTRLHTGVTRHAAYRMPTFSSVWFGWVLYNVSQTMEMFIDEIAIDTKPIGCTR